MRRGKVIYRGRAKIYVYTLTYKLRHIGYSECEKMESCELQARLFLASGPISPGMLGFELYGSPCTTSIIGRMAASERT